MSPTDILEADSASDFSDYRTSAAVSSTQSLTSSIQEHVYANGRRYHRKSEGRYALPSDEIEQDRLDMQHHLQLLMLDGKLCEAKFDNGDPQNVLDMGTGTGIWALDFGESHPGSRVIGVDLMPIQPSWTYPNVSFQTDDIEKPWTFKNSSFDFIHSRHISLGVKNWPDLIQQVYEHLTPGGVYEISDHSLDTLHCDDGTVNPSTALLQYYNLFALSLKATGVDNSLLAADYVRMLEAAGFVDVVVKAYKVPWGTWPKDKQLKLYGAWAWEILKTGLEAYGMFLITKFGGKSEEETRKMIADVLGEIEGGGVHGYHWHWQIVAKKPKA